MRRRKKKKKKKKEKKERKKKERAARRGSRKAGPRAGGWLRSDAGEGYTARACVRKEERRDGETRGRRILRPASRNREACRYTRVANHSRQPGPITYWFFTYDLIHYHSVIYICPACCRDFVDFADFVTPSGGREGGRVDASQAGCAARGTGEKRKKKEKRKKGKKKNEKNRVCTHRNTCASRRGNRAPADGSLMFFARELEPRDWGCFLPGGRTGVCSLVSQRLSWSGAKTSRSVAVGGFYWRRNCVY